MNFDLAKMIAMKVVRFEGGEITVYGRGMVLVPAETIVSFQEILEKKLGKVEADKLMLGIGESLTTTSTKRYLERKKDLRPVFQKLTTGDPSIEMGKEIFKMSGLGEMRTVEVTQDSSKYVIATKSPIAKEYLRLRGKSSAPVCSFLLGIVNGVLLGSKEAEYSAHEVMCLATGTTDECVFEFKKKH